MLSSNRINGPGSAGRRGGSADGVSAFDEAVAPTPSAIAVQATLGSTPELRSGRARSRHSSKVSERSNIRPVKGAVVDRPLEADRGVDDRYRIAPGQENSRRRRGNAARA